MGEMRIFVSHSTQDSAFADDLVRALRGAGADVWYDEHNLFTGDLLDVIQREVSARPVFVVVLSSAALISRWVRDECHWAYTLYQRGPTRIILPVVVEAVGPDAFEMNGLLFLEGFKRAGEGGGRPGTHEDIIAEVLRLLGLTPGMVPTRAWAWRRSGRGRTPRYGTEWVVANMACARHHPICCSRIKRYCACAH